MAKFEDVWSISKFNGLCQNTDEHNLGLSYAVDGLNFNTLSGGFKPFHKAQNLPTVANTVPDTTLALDTEHGDGALTLGFLTKRWQYNSGVIGRANTYENTYCIAVVDGKIFYRRTAQNTFVGQAWTEILNPATGTSFSFAHSKFDTTTYELNYLPPVQISASIISAIYAGTATYYTFDYDDYAFYEVHSDDGTTAYYMNRNDETITLTNTSKVRISSEDAPIDCLLITNSTDGMYCIYAPLDVNTLSIAYVPVAPDGATVDIKFGALARYAERIWGTAIDTDPDKLMYSAPYDVFNWEQYNDVPDDGAGDIQQPNWDGDKFIAIKGFGSSLLAIKERAIWRITGTTPSEFVMKKQYGEGTIAEDTFAVHGGYAFMLTDDDLKVYDGNSTNHLRYGYIRSLLEDALKVGDVNIGRMVQDDYVLQINTATYGNVFVIYNTAEGTINVCSSEGATALETYDGELYGLYPMNTYDSKGAVTGTYVQLGKFLPKTGTQFPVTWESAWVDVNAKNMVKSGFIVYLLFDCNNPSAETITFDIGIQTEKKLKSKTVTMKYNRVKRIRLNNSGRHMKLKLSIPAQNYEWKIGTGIQIYVEYDYD